ncbi:Protein required for attachment to host cells [Marinobacter daqiaonensis]|uniref:Protein required for attachment to host cells n=1 Tax=Marinobacter daqiaonensis TaxID=650891 RepID=A0A1I6GYI8_9GAMM|nr:host attachment protein [Marinobacter daqiaonensis]SFR47292.1 Protein required for attachment to host cells [Marinobacter daqiaonensis]
MAEYSVLVAEMAQARIYTLESSEAPEVENSPYLVEQKSLTNSEREASDSQVWTDTRRGANREHQSGQGAGGTAGIPHHNYDEHRDNNERMVIQSFANDVVTELKRVVDSQNVKKVVLCAEVQMLGFLRPELDALPGDKVQIEEVPKDLTGFSAHELHKKLADDGLLPPQKRPQSLS